jgi:hypothetical protein
MTYALSLWVRSALTRQCISFAGIASVAVSSSWSSGHLSVSAFPDGLIHSCVQYGATRIVAGEMSGAQLTIWLLRSSLIAECRSFARC